MLYVYFIQAGDSGPIKIGVAGDPQRRLLTLQAGNHVELKLLATRPGAYELERDLHATLAEGHIRGEWFALDTPGLTEEIQRARTLPDERYVTRHEAAALRERIETRAVRLAGGWSLGRSSEPDRNRSSRKPEAMRRCFRC